MMNILFLNSLGKSKWGGGEKWMVLAGKGLANRGHHVTIACRPGSTIERKSIEKGLEIFHFVIPSDIAFWKMATLKTFLLKSEIDVLICCQNKDVKIGARAARSLGVNAIFARQGIQNLSNKKKYIKPFTHYIDGIITNTKSIKNIYEHFGWFPADFIHVVYNGVEIPENTPIIHLHKEYGLTQDSQTIFSAGRLDHQKGFDLLIKVALRAKQQHLNWQFVIAGEGKLKSKLTTIAEKNGVTNMVHFIGFSDQVPSLSKSADVFVLPSRYEGMPNAVLEAMAVGKACVATGVNGAPELVEDGISGFLVASENVDQLFEKIKIILDDEKLRISMGLKAKERVQSHFTIENMIANLEKLFKDQLEKSVQ
jgi:glycosyltransferase involved in cell wall biosynthesis